MLFVTGLGRCGTSFLMHFFRDMDFYIGRDNDIDPVKRAGMEFSVCYAITRDMFCEFIEKGKPVNLDWVRDDCYWGKISLREQMLRFDHDRPIFQKEYRPDRISIFKDPRITWHPEIIRTWWEVRKDIRLIILHRDPKEIIESRNMCIERGADDMADPKRDIRLDEFKIDFCDFMTEVMRLDIPYRLFYYPNVLRQYDLVWKSCQDFGIIFDKNEGWKVWERIVDYNLVTNAQFISS